MTGILIFIVGSLAGFLVPWGLCIRKIKELEKEIKRMQKEVEVERETWYGFSAFNKKMAEIKEKRKQKIIDELKKTNKMSTAKATDFLDISRVTAFRYLEELENGGVIEQVGKTGRDVEYKVKK